MRSRLLPFLNRPPRSSFLASSWSNSRSLNSSRSYPFRSAYRLALHDHLVLALDALSAAPPPPATVSSMRPPLEAP